MTESDAELFSDGGQLNFPLQTSCSSSSESEPKDRAFFRSLDMTDLFRVRSSTPTTTQKQGTMVCPLSCC